MVQGSDIYQIGPDEKILGYGNVTSTAEAKEEVANHESIDGIMEELPLVSLLTIPRTDWSHQPPEREEYRIHTHHCRRGRLRGNDRSMRTTLWS